MYKLNKTKKKTSGKVKRLTGAWLLFSTIVFLSLESKNKLTIPLQTGEQENNIEIVNDTDNLGDGEDSLSVHFIDVGQGDSILINVDDHYMLVDAGENDEGNTVVNYLEKQGVKSLEYVIGTHPHSDHIGGLDTVIHNFEINKVILPDVVSTTKTFEEVLDALSEEDLKITKPEVGMEYKLGDATFIILAPNSSEYSDLNNYSIVIKVIYEETAFLLTGDAEKISEDEMLENGLDLSADILKLGHHGSANSSTNTFLDRVGASSAIISVGRNNKYGHPMSETVNRVLDRGINLYRTDEMGTIIVTTDGTAISFNNDAASENNSVQE